MLSPSIKLLLQGYRDYLSKTNSQEMTDVIHVDEVAAKIAKFYERIRNIIDYRESHLLRENTILRILKRSLILYRDNGKIAEFLIKEIIRSGHLPNDVIPETKIGAVGKLISQLVYLLGKSRGNRELSEWLTRISAAAIEEILDPPVKDRLLAETMFAALKGRLIMSGQEIDENAKATQLYVGIERALLRVDDDQLAYRLLKLIYPAWDNLTDAELDEIGGKIVLIKRTVDSYMKHPLGKHFLAFSKRYSTVFLLLGDIVFKQKMIPESLTSFFENQENVDMAAADAYKKRLAQQKKSLRRIAFLSVLSLFITKVLIAFALEIPIDIYLNQYVLENAVFNTLFPPLLLFVIIMFIRPPGRGNLTLIKKELEAVVLEASAKDYVLNIPKPKKSLIKDLVILIYIAVSIAVLYGTVKLLLHFNFSPASIGVFVLFTSIVAATGIRVNNRSKELNMKEKKSSFWGLVFDTVFMPFVSLGQFIIAGLSKLQFLVTLINLIDVPFQMFVIFIEHFNQFIRSKREEVQ